MMDVSAVETTPINVQLICDFPLIAWGVEKLIESAAPAMRLTGTAATVTQALQMQNTAPADVVLLDLDGENGVDTIPELLANANAKARVIVLTGVVGIETRDAAVLAGASGTVSKRESPTMLLKAIEKVHGGDFWVDRSATLRILVAVAKKKAEANPEQTKISRLTRKERMTAVEIARDASATTSDIAQRLHISQHTLRNHLTSIYSKLGVANRMELFAYAKRHGLT